MLYSILLEIIGELELEREGHGRELLILLTVPQIKHEVQVPQMEHDVHVAADDKYGDFHTDLRLGSRARSC